MENIANTANIEFKNIVIPDVVGWFDPSEKFDPARNVIFGEVLGVKNSEFGEFIIAKLYMELTCRIVVNDIATEVKAVKGDCVGISRKAKLGPLFNYTDCLPKFKLTALEKIRVPDDPSKKMWIYEIHVEANAVKNRVRPAPRVSEVSDDTDDIPW